MPELSAAPSINDSRTQALLKLIARLADLDLTPMLVYRIDSDALTNVDLLIDIDNLIETGGMVSAGSLTEAAQREMLKSAVPLHRFRGTPWAVKEALAALGWTQVSLLEGQSRWGGAVYPASQGWAVFRVMIDLVDGQPVPSGVVLTAAAAVKFFKPARAWLDSIWFVTPPASDVAPKPADKFTLGGIVKYQIDSARVPADSGLAIAIVSAATVDGYGPSVPIYDSHYRHSGITYGVNEPSAARRRHHR